MTLENERVLSILYVPAWIEGKEGAKIRNHILYCQSEILRPNALGSMVVVVHLSRLYVPEATFISHIDRIEKKIYILIKTIINKNIRSFDVVFSFWDALSCRRVNDIWFYDQKLDLCIIWLYL